MKISLAGFLFLSFLLSVNCIDILEFLEGWNKLTKQGDRILFLKTSCLFDNISETAMFTELHNQDEILLISKMISIPYNVFMFHWLQNIRFILSEFKKMRIVNKPLSWKNLDRHFLLLISSLHVKPFIHDSESTMAYHAHYFEPFFNCLAIVVDHRLSLVWYWIDPHHSKLRMRERTVGKMNNFLMQAKFSYLLTNYW